LAVTGTEVFFPRILLIGAFKMSLAANRFAAITGLPLVGLAYSQCTTQ
jgi:hypothetical protein